MISKLHAAQALSEALKTGGDFAELFFQDQTAQTISLRDGTVEDAVTQRIHGVGMRVFRGLSCVYVYSCDTTPSGLIALARRAALQTSANAHNARQRILISIFFIRPHPFHAQFVVSL